MTHGCWRTPGVDYLYFEWIRPDALASTTYRAVCKGYWPNGLADNEGDTSDDSDTESSSTLSSDSEAENSTSL